MADFGQNPKNRFSPKKRKKKLNIFFLPQNNKIDQFPSFLGGFQIFQTCFFDFAIADKVDFQKKHVFSMKTMLFDVKMKRNREKSIFSLFPIGEVKKPYGTDRKTF